MKNNTFAIVAILLWLISAVVAVTFFIKGNTEISGDDRVSVILKPAEKDLVLSEMRMLLEGVQGITAGLASGDMKQVSSSARAIGMASAVDVNPNLMMKLPANFKQQGMAVHKQFDQIADMADNGASHDQLLTTLAEQLSSCVACHSTYELRLIQSWSRYNSYEAQGLIPSLVGIILFSNKLA